MKRFFVMELGHADIYAGYATLDEAKDCLRRLDPVATDDGDGFDDEFGIVECDAEGRPIGEVVRL